jgi:hypothetical protein
MAVINCNELGDEKRIPASKTFCITPSHLATLTKGVNSCRVCNVMPTEVGTYDKSQRVRMQELGVSLSDPGLRRDDGGW